jgi:hypothetical protein
MATLFCDPALASGANNGTSWEDAYSTIQAAVNAGGATDDIWVKARTVTLASAITFNNANGTRIYGGFDVGLTGTSGSVAGRSVATVRTTLDGQLAVYNLCTITRSTRLDGFVVTRSGVTNSAININYASAAVVIANTKILDNVGAVYGSGLWVQTATTLEMTDCEFEGNTRAQYGTTYLAGGVGATFTRCTWLNNTVSYGGAAIRTTTTGGTSVTMTDCVIDGNHVTATTFGMGGQCYFGTNTTLVEMTRCVVKNGDAVATCVGGGAFFDTCTTVRVTNCVFYRNVGDYGGAVSVSVGTANFTNCTFAYNNGRLDGGALRVRSGGTANITNCIFWGNTSAGATQIALSSSTVNCTYSDVQGGYTGTGNVNVDPKFRGAGPHPYDLGELSNVVDSGNAGATYYPSTDMLGRARVDYPGHAGTGTGSPAYSDMGAYELQLPLIAPRKMWVNDGGTWKQVAIAHENVAGTFKPVVAAEVDVAGAWKYS